jgi:hypothetical protein
MVFQMRILPGVSWIGSPLLGLASFWDLLWCLGLPTNSRVLLNPLPRQSTLPLLVVKDRGDQRGGSEWEPIKILLEGD